MTERGFHSPEQAAGATLLLHGHQAQAVGSTGGGAPGKVLRWQRCGDREQEPRKAGWWHVGGFTGAAQQSAQRVTFRFACEFGLLCLK